jgi:hypothetical protein
MMIIGGAAIGSLLIGNSIKELKALGGGLAKVFKGPRYHKQDYLDCILLLGKLMKLLRSEGPVALEPHIENPKESNIFSDYPKLLADQTLVHLICDTLRLVVVSSGTLDPHAVEEVMDNSIKTHHHHSLKPAEGLQGLADAFDLDAPPSRIEVYDNAHIQGSDAVGGMIVAGADGFLKSQYRKFNIRSEAGANSDDFGMMREVLTRRFERLLKEDPDRTSGMWPDLLLIDGGAGQLSAVAGVLAELGVEDVALIGVAKGIDRDAGKEEFHREGLPPMALPRNDPVLYFVQRLRDEAHRWANGAHRAKRAKAVSATPLDEIPGVGAGRKRALLAHFGSAKAVSRAGVPDLMAVEGISQGLAEAIHGFFNPG